VALVPAPDQNNQSTPEEDDMEAMYGLVVMVGRVAGAVALAALVGWLAIRWVCARRRRARLLRRLYPSPMWTLRSSDGGMAVGPDGRPFPWPASGGPREIACGRGEAEYRRDRDRYLKALAESGRELDELRIEKL
jgi:hypothetical protein